MADNNNQNIDELTQEQKVLILQLFKNGVYKNNNNVASLIRELSSLWGLEEE